jgi:UDP-N-acetylmuramoyl-L-alanyl-D-glutamate--2,6-diaminopimelate ligase
MNQGKEAAGMQTALNRRAGVSLRSVCPDARFFGSDDVRVTSCCCEASSCRPGDVFVALLDFDRDGHDHVQEAIRRGARAVLAESYLPVSVPQCVVPDSREAYGNLCQELAGRPAQAMHVVGITGTNGKTTTSLLAASVLRAAGLPAGFTTTLLRSDSESTAAAGRSTPAPAELADWMARMAANRCSHAVVELSSRALAQRRVAGIPFDGAVVTNLRRDHIDFHGNLANYRQAKARLFEQLSPRGFAVVNADDPGSRILLPKLTCPVITFGITERAEISATVVERHPGEQTFLIMAGNEAVPVRTRMIGDHHVANCLAAAAVGLIFGADLTTIARGLEAIERIPNRMDRIECGQPFQVYVDCGDTPDRLAAALRSARQVARGRVIGVFGTPDGSDRDERPLLGRALDRGADVAVLTSAAEGNDEPLRIIHDLLDGFDRPARARVMPGRVRAILWALDEARAGDAVVIAGSDRRSLFACGQQEKQGDIATARNWLYKSAANHGTAAVG